MSKEQQISKGNPRKLSRLCCSIASVFTIIIGISHLFVPIIFPWEDLITDLYEPIKWALFAMNFFFSLLLLWGGLLTLMVEFKGVTTKGMKNWIVGGMSLFWLVGMIYEIVYPFPIVEARWVLPGIGFVIFCLYGVCVIVNNK